MTIEHIPPKPRSANHLTAVFVPTGFVKVINAAAEKSGVLFEDQLIKWAMIGADCERLHSKKIDHRRTRK